RYKAQPIVIVAPRQEIVLHQMVVRAPSLDEGGVQREGLPAHVRVLERGGGVVLADHIGTQKGNGAKPGSLNSECLSGVFTAKGKIDRSGLHRWRPSILLGEWPCLPVVGEVGDPRRQVVESVR